MDGAFGMEPFAEINHVFVTGARHGLARGVQLVEAW